MENRMKSKILDEFYCATECLVNPKMEEWMKDGGKVIGYYCSFMPEEIITAAGFMPYRIRAIESKETIDADAYVSQLICTFTRHSLNLALNGKFNFLDGMIWTTNCDHIRRTIDYWNGRVDIPFLHLIQIPKKTGEDQVEKYKMELKKLIKRMEEVYEIKITEKALSEAIQIHNKKRALLRQIYELRKSDNPVLTGADMLAITVAGTSMPVLYYIECLEKLLKEMQVWKKEKIEKVRILLTGSELDNPKFVNIIEEMGTIVVNDSLCLGSRCCWTDIDENTDSLTAIARYQIQKKPSCPRLYDAQERQIGYLIDLAKEYHVEGVISERLRFCDHWAAENVQLEEALEKEKIPFMVMDREYHLGNIGQIQTRVQAFVETIRGGR